MFLRPLLLTLALGLGAAQEPLLSVRAMPAQSHRALLQMGPALDDSSLRDALRSGLPVRVRARVELWQDQLLDDLEDDQSFVLVLRYEPLERSYLLYDNRGLPVRAFADYETARSAVEIAYLLEIRPREPGRYYYLASVEIETLALSDLEEVENWLRGELRPAVRGNSSILTAVGQGAKRLLIRVLGLPAREISARSELFRVR